MRDVNETRGADGTDPKVQAFLAAYVSQVLANELPEDHEEPPDELFDNGQRLDCGHMSMDVSTALFVRNKRWAPGRASHCVKLTGRIEGALRGEDGRLPAPVEVRVRMASGEEAVVLARLIACGENYRAGLLDPWVGVEQGPHYALAAVVLGSDALERRKERELAA